MKEQIEAYRNSFSDKACRPPEIVRISFEDYLHDQDLFLGANPFKTDTNKILSSQAIRREDDRTQVVPYPDNPHIRTRITHTVEVVTISNYISETLGLNTELTEAIAYGHDIGHGPIGHVFEQTLEKQGIDFRHEKFSGITAAFIERKGKGLNLTKETINGILEHSRGNKDITSTKDEVSENLVVMYSDKIAYIFSDINDLQRLNLMSDSDLKLIDSYFPGQQRDRVFQCVAALMKESVAKGYISFSDSPVAKNFKTIKDLMHRYYNKLNRQVYIEKIKSVHCSLGEVGALQNYDPTLITALLTDKELDSLDSVISSCRRINLDHLQNFGVFEYIKNGFLEHQSYAGLDLRLQQQMAKFSVQNK
jgi:dGTP triphosphohydrolase